MTAPAPIFVVGCQRSGTTLLRLILDSHPAISCGPETRFLQGLAPVTGSDWHRMRLYGFTRDDWHRRFAELFGGFQQDYAERRGKTRWADKTPLYALHLGFIEELFPDALVIHVIRDGPDVVASHRDRFGWWSSIKAVEKWPRYVRQARAWGSAAGAARYLEVRYEDLVGDTEATLRRALDFVGEPWDDAVLHHTDHDHDVPDSYRRFSASRRSGEAGRAVYRSRVGAGRRQDPLTRALIRLRQHATRRALGYR